MPRRVKSPASSPPRHFMQEWRAFRDLTLEQIAERMETSKGHVSNVLNYKVGLTQEFLAAYAYAVRCEPRDLLTVNPLITPDIEILEAYRAASPEAQRIVKSILRTGTDE